MTASAATLSTPAEVVSVTALGLLAILLGGAIVAAVLRGLHLDTAQSVGQSIPNAGRYIGWLERGLIFTVIVAGMPSAAALVIGVKTAARFPQFEKEERFVEYYLIGTLLSLSIALAAGLVARALLDLPLLG
ncbi:MAG TPA: hypothetical protein VMF31_09020 [Solirubrobacterales bacterium]|nr:hypothetical protein [Solirubrobacterales bacterium]